jgi:hypothetical protein
MVLFIKRAQSLRLLFVSSSPRLYASSLILMRHTNLSRKRCGRSKTRGSKLTWDSLEMNQKSRSLARVARSANKPLVPTRNGEAPLLAAQRRR